MSSDVLELAEAAAARLPNTQPGDLSHDALALALGERWADEARHVAAWGRWLFWDGQRWAKDHTLHHMTEARDFLRELAAEMDDPKVAKRLRSSESVARVVGLARSNRTQAARVDQWDAQDWLMATPGGTVDLRTGRTREPRPDDYMTLSTAVAPAPEGTRAPQWERFLDEITDGDTDLIAYLQRWVGYSLTGSIREHGFVFGHGAGANGKGVFTETIAGILEDYAATIPTEMLMVSRNDRHPTELARLRGKRFVVGSETEEGRRWAESKVKALTGGDTIAARYMRQDFFEFDPRFKLFIVGNHRPSLRGVDEAMRRRLHLIPFTVTIPPEKRDQELPNKLVSEWPAILRWAIDGCLAWQDQGLAAPAAVKDATEEYLDAEDAFSLWLDECAEKDPNAWESSASLYNSWKLWAKAAGESFGSKKRLARDLQKRGYDQKRGSDGSRGYAGLRLPPVDTPRCAP